MNVALQAEEGKLEGINIAGGKGIRNVNKQIIFSIQHNEPYMKEGTK